MTGPFEPIAPEQIELTQDQSEYIFKRRILRRFLDREDGSRLPTDKQAVILGGQPGCGKTGLLQNSATELRQHGATWAINGDDFYAFHPNYQALMARHGAAASEMLKGEVSRWVRMTVDAAQRRGVNIVFESTMRQPDVVERQLAEFKANGYRTHAKVMAVSEEESWQGNRFRFESQMAVGWPARLAPRAVHDEAARNVLTTVDRIEAKQAVDRVTVYVRGEKAIYDNRLEPSGWTSPPAAGRTIETERKRPWSAAKLERHRKNWDTIERMASERLAATGSSMAASEIANLRRERQEDDKAIRRRAIATHTKNPERSDPER